MVGGVIVIEECDSDSAHNENDGFGNMSSLLVDLSIDASLLVGVCLHYSALPIVEKISYQY